MIRKVGRSGEVYGHVGLPKEYVGTYVRITRLSKKEIKNIQKAENEYKDLKIKRDNELLEHLNKLKDLRGY